MMRSEPPAICDSEEEEEEEDCSQKELVFSVLCLPDTGTVRKCINISRVDWLKRYHLKTRFLLDFFHLVQS